MNIKEDQENSTQRKPLFEPGSSLPSDWAEQALEGTKLLERRLERLETALGLEPLSAR